jgi:excisionase family DNA binding protein
MYVASENGQIRVHPKRVRTDIVGQKRVFIEATARPFDELASTDLLDTRDVCRLFPCSRRTIYRWMAEGALRPHGKVGREFFFTKREVLRWFNERPHLGRPLERW